MKHLLNISLRFSALASFAAALIVLHTAPAGATAPGGCPPIEPLSAPRANIGNGVVNAVVLLPNAKTGYYRGSRFDWSGVVGCLTYKGNNYFGVWFPEYDPTRHDSITGPVDEFLSANGESALSYDNASPGGIFVKPGVGALRRIDEKAYSFLTPYPIVDGGKWAVDVSRSKIAFRQKLNTQIGISYVYKKTLRLEPGRPVLAIEYQLKNTGSETIDTQVYNHDFFMLDSAPTGPPITVQFPFTPKTDRPLGNGAHVVGNEIVFDRELSIGQSVFAAITGYSERSSDFDFVVANKGSGIGVEETGDQPLSRIFFWSKRDTVCPEAFVHIKIEPGQTARWTIRYRFSVR